MLDGDVTCTMAVLNSYKKYVLQYWYNLNTQQTYTA